MPELERELRELRVEWPETPDLAAAVAVRLAAAAGPAARRAARWRGSTGRRGSSASPSPPR